jgi:glycosyltransferase involved in cell wall biosynthesis
MKVLYFHQHFSTPDGSTGTRSYEMAQCLIRRGHQVTMVCGSGFMAKTGLRGEADRGIRRGQVAGIDVIEICLPYSNYDSLVKRSFIFLQYAVRSIRIAWREKYDLLFASSTPLTASIPGIIMRLLKPRKKFVFEVRDLWPELPKAMGVIRNPIMLAAMSLLEKISYWAMHGGVALSPGIAEGMRRRSPKAKPIAIVPNGCDLDDFCPDLPIEPAPGDFPSKGLRCVFTGAHGLANGLNAVLDAAKVLKMRERSDIHLIFIGNGKLKPRLIARAKAEDLDNCVFLDPLPKAQLSAIMRHTEVGMMILANVPAFYYGTSPNKFFDYISCGLPVLNNYPGWLADLIGKHHCGLAVPPENPAAFADALVYFADHPRERAEMGRNARRMAETDFARNTLASRWVDFLEQTAKAGGKRSDK